MSWARGLLVVVAAGQLAVPASMILRREATLRDGVAYRFRTQPVDPYDAFRGRYVALGFEQDHAPWRGTGVAGRGTSAFAAIETGADGFARVRELTPAPPATGGYLKVRIRYLDGGANAGTAYFSMPFDRYFMEEKKAPIAERVYREHSRGGTIHPDTHVVVRVRNGDSVLEDLCVAGTPIRRYLAEHPDGR